MTRFNRSFRKSMRMMARSSVSFVIVLGLAISMKISPAEGRAVDNGSILVTPTSIADLFTVVPNSPATCPGDNASGNFLWHTFLVDDSVDPFTLHFSSTGPILTSPDDAGKVAVALRDRDGRRVASMAPDVSSASISGIPTLSLSGTASFELRPGNYRIGIACTLGSPGPEQVKSLWSTSVGIASEGRSSGPSIRNLEPPDSARPTSAVPDSERALAVAAANGSAVSADVSSAPSSAIALVDPISSREHTSWWPSVGVLLSLLIGILAFLVARNSRSSEADAS